METNNTLTIPSTQGTYHKDDPADKTGQTKRTPPHCRDQSGNGRREGAARLRLYKSEE